MTRKLSGKVRFGVVGMGMMGRLHAQSIAQASSADFCLGAVADVFESAARSAGQQLSVPWFADPEQMFASGLVDAVVIATPHAWHPVQTVQAARAGLHVLCEKPLAVTVGPAREMLRQCRQRKVALGVMFQTRLRGVMKKMKQIVDSGELGEVHRLSMIGTRWYRSQAYYDSGAWRGTWDGEGGGILLNQAPHSLDVFTWIGGMPKSVTAILDTRLHKIEVENTAHILCQYGGGKTGYIYVSTAECPPVEQLQVVGDKGLLINENNTLRLCRLAKPISRDLFENKEHRADFIKPPDAAWEDVTLEADSPDIRLECVAAFASHILRGTPMVADARAGMNQLELTNAMYLSGFTNRTVELPVDAGKVDRLIAKLERERSTGRGQNQRQQANKAFQKLLRKKSK